MRLLADNVLVTALAMAQQRHQVGLSAAWQEQRRLFTGQTDRFCLQSVDRGVIAVNIITHFCLGHGLAHRGAGAGHGVTA
ncbi:hypothetical protein D3C75_1298690 [compost metagenome]